MPESAWGANTGARAVNPLGDEQMRTALVAVETDASISHVILDAREGNCFLTYECGSRAYSFREPARLSTQKSPPWHTVRANHPPRNGAEAVLV